MDKRCLSRRSILSTCKPIRRELPPVAKKSHLRGRQELDLAHQAVSAAKLSSSTRSPPIPIGPHTERIRILQRLNWSVQRVSHVAMNAVNPIHVGTGAHPPS